MSEPLPKYDNTGFRYFITILSAEADDSDFGHVMRCRSKLKNKQVSPGIVVCSLLNLPATYWCV